VSARVRMDRLNELIRELTIAPKAIRDEGMEIIREEVEGGAQEIRSAYPEGPTGRMRRGVKTEFPSSTILVGVIRSTDPASHLWEFGTQQRSYQGANRGSVRPHPTTVPIARARRRRIHERLKTMLTRKGYQLSGD
jgi:hypothetical protein